MAINSCLLDFCLNGSKVATNVRPAHDYAQTCCNLRSLATRDIQLNQFSASHVSPVWPLRKHTTASASAIHPGQTWSHADIIKHADYAHSKDAGSEVDSSHNSVNDSATWEDYEQNNNTNAVIDDIRLNSDSGVDVTNEDYTMRLRNKRTRRNKVKVKVSERISSKESQKKRSGSSQPDGVQDHPSVHPEADTVDATQGNVQLPLIKPLSEDSLKPTVSWVQNKSVVRLRDAATCGVDQSMSSSSPALLAKLCQTSGVLGPDVCAITSMSVLSTKNRHNGMSPPRKSMTRQCGESKPKVTKVFWSEAQTLNQNQLGMTFPGAPPCTPTPEVARHYEYVASMTDIRAQRALRAHLDAIDMIQKRKAEKDKEMQRKREKTYQKTLQIEAKKKQRSQIYALNKVMTEMEHKLFTEFCKQKTDTT